MPTDPSPLPPPPPPTPPSPHFLPPPPGSKLIFLFFHSIRCVFVGAHRLADPIAPIVAVADDRWRWGGGRPGLQSARLLDFFFCFLMMTNDGINGRVEID